MAFPSCPLRQKPKEVPMFDHVEVISCYTRADALADGVLVDVSETAREAGFRIPVAITAAVWGDCVEWTPEDNTHGRYQDQAGRLWDVLWMARLAASSHPDSSRLAYEIVRVRRAGSSSRPATVSLILDCGPGDDASPVMTIGFTHDF
jgi:hypothetical protein